MLSTLSTWDFGSHGAFDGSYALKIATQPRAGAQNVAIKRLTFRKRGPIRLEFYFTFKPEANELRLSETDVRSIGFLYDLQTGDTRRAMPGASCRICASSTPQDGEHVQKWQFKRRTTDVQAARHREQDRDALSPRARRTGRTCPAATRSSATTRSRPR